MKQTIDYRVIEKSKAELFTVDSSRDSVDSGIYGVGE